MINEVSSQAVFRLSALFKLIKDLSDYALYRQMDVRKVFEEHISGAKKNEERHVLCEAIAYCKEHSISTLLVSELSRMGRNALQKERPCCVQIGKNILI